MNMDTGSQQKLKTKIQNQTWNQSSKTAGDSTSVWMNDAGRLVS